MPRRYPLEQPGPDNGGRVPDPPTQGNDPARGRPQAGRTSRGGVWPHEEFRVACLQREVSARESHGGESRIRAARFPGRKSLEEFDYDQRPLSR